MSSLHTGDDLYLMDDLPLQFEQLAQSQLDMFTDYPLFEPIPLETQLNPVSVAVDTRYSWFQAPAQAAQVGTLMDDYGHVQPLDNWTAMEDVMTEDGDPVEYNGADFLGIATKRRF